MNNFRLNKSLWVITGVLALIASAAGVFYQAIYAKVISDKMMAGTISQDIQAIAVAVVLLGLTAVTGKRDIKKQTVILGLLGFIFYAYGLYSIERVYNGLYLIYMAIMGLSFYGIVIGVVSLKDVIAGGISIAKKWRYASIGFSLFIPTLFYILWIAMLVPLITAGNKPEFLYGVYIIDLVFVMPAFVIVAYQEIRNRSLGLLLAPALFIFSFNILFPLATGELLKPNYGFNADIGSMIFFGILSLIFLALGIGHLRYLETGQ